MFLIHQIKRDEAMEQRCTVQLINIYVQAVPDMDEAFKIIIIVRDINPNADGSISDISCSYHLQ